MKKQSKPKNNSIQDIAEALDLSPATISRVLNNHPHVHENTRSKVMKMVERVGYRRNVMASGLRTNKTNTIGMIIPRISMFVHAEIMTVVQNILHKHGYNLIVCQSNDSIEMEKELAETLCASRVDAVIVACTLFTTQFDHFNILTENNIPIIFYDRVPTAPYRASVVRGDDFRGGYLAASHLIELGCKRIAYISGPMSCNLYIDRYNGFKKAMEQNHIPLIKDYCFFHELNVVNARKDLHSLFHSKPYPDAVLATNDVTALETLSFAKEIGIQVPGELKIVGYSNDPRSSIVSPSITTVDQFPAQIGKAVSEEVLRILKNGVVEVGADAPSIIIPVQLIRRMST